MAYMRHLLAISASSLIIGGCLLMPTTPTASIDPEQKYRVQGGEESPPPKKEECACDVTGGGEIFFEGDRFNFGFNALTIAGNSRIHGNVNIVGRDTDQHFLGDVTGIVCEIDPTTSHPRLEGTVTITGVLRTNSTDAGEPFTFVVTDVGEPGTIDSVSFEVDGTTIFDVTDLGGEGDVPPGGGNIQIHSEECEEE